MAKKICVVGAGRWGKNHIRTFQNLGALGGVVETDADRRTWVKSEFGADVNVYASVAEALEQDFDGFTVATPAETHMAVAQQIILAGKSLLVEKPLALSSEEAAQLTALANRHKVVLMVGHVMLFHPAIRKIKDTLTDGRLGKLQYIYSNRVNLGTVRKEENILWSFAPHDISIFQYLVEATPIEVASRGGAFVQPHIHDSTMTMLKYPGNIQGHIFVSWLHPFKEQRLVVIGDKGMLSFDDAGDDKSLLFYEKGIDWIDGEPVKRDGATEAIPYENSMPLTNELQYFIDSLDKGVAEIADGQNGVDVLSILERATLSILERPEDYPAAQSATSGGSSSDAEIHGTAFVHESAVVDAGAKIGEKTKVWHFSHVQPNSSIGKNCSLGQNVNIANNVQIGDNVKIQNNVSVYEGVELEDYVFCGPSMVFTNINTPRSKYPQRGAEHYLKTLVREGASLGANCTIVCGTTIGKHSLVGAGAVVTKDVPDFALVVGSPAKPIGWVCECGSRIENSQLEKGNKDATCKSCNIQYTLSTPDCLVQVGNTKSVAATA